MKFERLQRNITFPGTFKLGTSGNPFHLQLQKVEVELTGWFFKTIGFDKKVLSLIEKVNKNYRGLLIRLERLYEKRILRNDEYRKESSENGAVDKTYSSSS
jgi:hypothetical protein